MTPANKTSDNDDLARMRVNRISEEPGLEDLPPEWAAEDREIEGRRPDMGESEEDTSEL